MTSYTTLARSWDTPGHVRRCSLRLVTAAATGTPPSFVIGEVISTAGVLFNTRLFHRFTAQAGGKTVTVGELQDSITSEASVF
ncbi:hypothetical protein E2C01_096849 [Portunus trituberculatus]|uniref:Uncharacterized protein n=1 Tax=Portunus trituberculatus TaxID=210409 RepID=A0A5B7K8D8_PORTR|nr:hypothetical protein [Portunus trituberculatus]